MISKQQATVCIPQSTTTTTDLQQAPSSPMLPHHISQISMCPPVCVGVGLVVCEVLSHVGFPAAFILSYQFDDRCCGYGPGLAVADFCDLRRWSGKAWIGIRCREQPLNILELGNLSLTCEQR